MQMRIDGIRVRKVSRMRMVHCAEPPPSPVIRNSFGFVSVALSGRGEGANGAAADGWGSTIGATPAPAGKAIADVAAREIIRQSIARIITVCFTPVSFLASQPVPTPAVLRA